MQAHGASRLQRSTCARPKPQPAKRCTPAAPCRTGLECMVRVVGRCAPMHPSRPTAGTHPYLLRSVRTTTPLMLADERLSGGGGKGCSGTSAHGWLQLRQQRNTGLISARCSFRTLGNVHIQNMTMALLHSRQWTAHAASAPDGRHQALAEHHAAAHCGSVIPCSTPQRVVRFRFACSQCVLSAKLAGSNLGNSLSGLQSQGACQPFSTLQAAYQVCLPA